MMMKIILKKINIFIFGQVAQGETLPPPTVHTTYPKDYKDFYKWANELNVSSSYKR